MSSRATADLPLVDRHPSLTVIFKGSNRCNAGCTFCSVGDAGARLMEWADFEIMARELERLVAHRGVERLELTFHGGEPTLLGADFIDRACARIARLARRTGFSMQSNLLHLDDDILAVIERHQINVGTSMDPIAGDRLDGNGGDAFPVWRESYLRLSARARAPGAIFVVTRKALGRAARLLEVADSLAVATGKRFGLQLNPVYRQGKAAANDDLLVTPEEFGDFLVDSWRLWEASPKRVRLSPIQDFADHFFPTAGRTPGLTCSFKGACSSHHLGIDFDLNVAGCGRRLDSKAFLGNLRERPLVDILETSEESRLISTRSRLLQEGACKSCEYFSICCGGCPDDAALASGNLMDRFCWCAGYRRLFTAMAEARATFPVRRDVGPDSAAVPTTVIAALEPSEMTGSDAGAPGRELWFLPTRDARALRFDGGLAKLLGDGRTPIRLFVHNDRVRSLALWERHLRRPDVQVVLFETAGLDPALAIVNGLGANVQLDVVGILRTAGAAALLEGLLERFLHDGTWSAQVTPFSEILLHAVHGRPPRHLNRWGLTPTRYALEPSGPAEASTEPATVEVLKGLRREEAFTLTDWLNQRPVCRGCDFLPLCGAQLAAGDGKGCAPEAKAMVQRLDAVACELRPELANLRPRV